MGKRGTDRWLKLIQRVPLIKKPELLNDILEETDELIKIFVTSIKTAEKKSRLGVIECSVLDVCFLFDVGRSMFDVRRSSLKTTRYGMNATCERLQNNLALMGCWPLVISDKSNKK